MEIKKILSLKETADYLRNLYGKWKNKCRENGGQTSELKFNGSPRYAKGFGEHIMYVSSFVTLKKCDYFLEFIDDFPKEDRRKFWEYFDEYCNEHIEDIFQYIGNKFQEEAGEHITELKEEEKKIREFLNKMENGNK